MAPPSQELEPPINPGRFTLILPARCERAIEAADLLAALHDIVVLLILRGLAVVPGGAAEGEGHHRSF